MARAVVVWRGRGELRLAAGFSLLELLLALSLGVLFSGAMLQTLLADGQTSLRFAQLLRERGVQARTLELVRGDLSRATAVSATPELEQHSCGLSGRLPVLHLSTPAGAITYSLGAAPSAIWRGQVLMRCGPAYGLDGELALGTQAQNRVVIDGLAASATRWTGCQALLPAGAEQPLDLAGSSGRAFSACLAQRSGLVGLRMQQQFPVGGSTQPRRISTELLVALLG